MRPPSGCDSREEAQGAGAPGGAGLSVPGSGARALATWGASGASLAFPAQGLRSQLCGSARTVRTVRRFLSVDSLLCSRVILDPDQEQTPSPLGSLPCLLKHWGHPTALQQLEYMFTFPIGL